MNSQLIIHIFINSLLLNYLDSLELTLNLSKNAGNCCDSSVQARVFSQLLLKEKPCVDYVPFTYHLPRVGSKNRKKMFSAALMVVSIPPIISILPIISKHNFHYSCWTAIPCYNHCYRQFLWFSDICSHEKAA